MRRLGERRVAPVVCVEAVNERATEGNAQQLHPAADPKHGHAMLPGGCEKRKLRIVARGIRHARPCGAGTRRVQIFAAGEKQPVEPCRERCGTSGVVGKDYWNPARRPNLGDQRGEAEDGSLVPEQRPVVREDRRGAHVAAGYSDQRRPHSVLKLDQKYLRVKSMLLDPLPPFANHLPVHVRFGDGVLAELPAVLAEFCARRPLVFVDEAVSDRPEFLGVLPPQATVAVLDAGEPTIESVDDAAQRLAGHDAVVAVGGGSTLDTAKGARLAATAGRSIRHFVWPGEPEPVPPPRVPLVTVPTTAGTGSEVTGGVVMVDRERGIKVGAASPWNRAQRCLVDPRLTLTLPAAPTLYGGLDVLAQAVGAIVARTCTPVGDALALEALRLVRYALPAVVADGSDRGARSRMACAALLAGLAMNVSEAGTDHSLGHALGVRHGIPHGLSVGVMLVESMEHDRAFVPERFERIADALGAPASGEPNGSRAVEAVAALLARVGCPTLRSLGVSDADVGPLAQTALAGWIPIEPGPWTTADIEAAYRRALAIERRRKPED